MAAAVSDARWSEEDTTPQRIEEALRKLLYERHAADLTLVPARVLNMVVVADYEWRGEVLNRLEHVGALHPSRTIICLVQEGRNEIGAVATVSESLRSGASIGVVHETVEIFLGPGHLERVDTIIDPLIIAELPTVVWSPHHHDDAVEALQAITDVILIDIDDPVNFEGAVTAMRRSLALSDGGTYVVDLAWLRTLPWRERVAGVFSDPSRAGALAQLRRLYVRHHVVSIGSALLFTGWIASRLGWQTRALERAKGGVWQGSARTGSGSAVTIELTPTEQLARGIGGVTLSGAGGFSYTLDRGPGGMTAREQRAGSRPSQWRILGAGRGEGGILGEGVRQALTRDAIYTPAVKAARSLSK